LFFCFFGGCFCVYIFSCDYISLAYFIEVTNLDDQGACAASDRLAIMLSMNVRELIVFIFMFLFNWAFI